MCCLFHVLPSELGRRSSDSELSDKFSSSMYQEQGLEPLRSAFHKKGHVLDTKMCKECARRPHWEGGGSRTG